MKNIGTWKKKQKEIRRNKKQGERKCKNKKKENIITHHLRANTCRKKYRPTSRNKVKMTCQMTIYTKYVEEITFKRKA